MLLCLDIGNTHIFGGVFHQDKLLFQFRYPSTSSCTSDQLGVFFKTVLRENQIKAESITAVAICSVVTSLDYSVRSAFVKYFNIDPFFLTAESARNFKIDYLHPQEIGADRIASVIAAYHFFPKKNLIIVDLGTATTFDVITANRAYLGGVIIPGIQTSMKALHENTAKLPPVNIIKPHQVVGKTTASNIQAGLYYSHLGAIREISQQINVEVFSGEKALLIGTGGFCYLFEEEHLFYKNIPDLVLQGIRLASIEK